MVFLIATKGKANRPNNYLAWAGAMHSTTGARYGPMAKVFTDQVSYVVPDFEADDVPQANDPDIKFFVYQPQCYSSLSNSRPRGEEKRAER